MANLNFDINTVLQQAFGIKRGKPFDSSQVIETEIRKEKAYSSEDLPASNDEEGTEFLNVRNAIQSNLPTGQLVFMPMKLGGLVLPNEPTVFIQGKKRIIETALVGSTRKGTVKELISIEDYNVTIRGVALNYQSTKVYPEDTVKDLHDLFLKNESLEVESALTALLGIYRLVIKSVSFPEMIGIQHTQAYEFQCVSDEDFILTID